MNGEIHLLKGSIILRIFKRVDFYFVILLVRLN